MAGRGLVSGSRRNEVPEGGWSVSGTLAKPSDNSTTPYINTTPYIKKRPTLLGQPLNCYVYTLLEVVHLFEVVFLAADYDILEILLACTGWDKVTADDILLKTFEVIDTGADCSLAEDLGSLLE